MIRFTNHLGFQLVTALVAVDRDSSDTEFLYVDNTPEPYREASTDRDNARRDPVSQHCKHANVPIVWDQETYTSCGMGERWELQAGFGYHTGIALATHMPKGLHFFIGVDRDAALPACRVEVSRMVADLQLFAVHAQDAALRVLLPEAAPLNELPALTSRELESLRWTMDGKTAWEVGRILGISEQTAVRHLNNATHKLECVNKHHAAIKALRLGLVR